jgi:putative ABC transport system permease protein
MEMLMPGNILQDLRYSARMLQKNPGFVFIAVLTLALGIGANTAIFSIIDVLLFRPLPVSKPNELVRIFSGETRGNAGWSYVSLPAFQQYRDSSEAFDGLAAYVDRFPANVSAGKFGTERVDAGMVTGNYFQLLGATAKMGRTLLADDDRKGAAAGIFGLISHSTARATHDFGIRMALGAQSGHVLWLVLKKGLALAVLGVLLGLGAALWLTRLLVSLLLGVSRNDALTFVAVAALTLLVALLACYLPARRATRVDPLVALRNE